MDPVTAIAVIGSVLVGASLLSKKTQTVEPTEPANDTRTIVGRNADALGYERIAEGESLGTGQVQVVTDDSGAVIGEVAQAEGGNLVYSNTKGETRVVTEGEVEIDALPPQSGNMASAALAGVQTGQSSMTNGANSFPAPTSIKSRARAKRNVTPAVRDARINAARRQGFTFKL